MRNLKKVKVPIRGRPYYILIGKGLILKAGSIIKSLSVGDDALIVTSKKIAAIYGKKIKDSLGWSGISCRLELVPDSERSKSDRILVDLLNRIGRYDKNRALFIVALGGGVIGDLSGFAASIYKRGIPYIQIPTTLLAQVDSAIGGKTAIDLPAAKNLAGSFYQPKVVISDIATLESLSVRQIRNGLSECIKYGVIKDKRLFEYLENKYQNILRLEKNALENIIMSCSRIKARIVASDEFDKKDKRIVLNYGHTVGHAIESAAGYSRRYNHGEAVAIGMVCAARIASSMGLLKETERFRIEYLIKKCGLPVRISGLRISRIYRSLLHDKKSKGGKNRFVLPVGIGKVRVVRDVPRHLIISSIKSCT